MTNPGGNYPGRQIGIGMLKNELPAFTYLVTGRSKSSQERYASPFIESENSIRIKPINTKEPFDEFRHYQAVVVDPETGFVLISNNQAMVVPAYEALKFCRKNRYENPVRGIEKILAAIGPEYDNPKKPTSRIFGAIYPDHSDLSVCDERLDACLGITAEPDDAKIFHFLVLVPNEMIRFVQTYDGNIDYKNLDSDLIFSDELIFFPEAKTPRDLAEELYEMTDYIDSEYGDLRVCVIAGVRNGKGPGGWEIARKNRYPFE